MKKIGEISSDEFPAKYRIVFDLLYNDEDKELQNKENNEIDELRRVIMRTNEPEYFYTTSASGYAPIFRVNLPIR